MKEKQLSHKKVYDCFFMELYEDDVLLPSGATSKRIYIEHPGAAAVLPILPNGNVLLIQQYRYPIRSIVWEIPAGKKDDPMETGEACVKREIEEETGYNSSQFEFIMNVHNCLGYSDELIELFFAYDVYQVDQPIEADDDECIDVIECSIDDINRLFEQGEISDAKTIIALQEYLRRYELTTTQER